MVSGKMHNLLPLQNPKPPSAWLQNSPHVFPSHSFETKGIDDKYVNYKLSFNKFDIWITKSIA